MSITTSTPTARQLFETNVRYVVPPYQRRYVWNEKDQWQPLWEDIRNLAKDLLNPPHRLPDDPHFLGTVVVRQLQYGGTEPAKQEVIDGQQRLTTLQILLDATEEVLNQRAGGYAAFLSPLIQNHSIYTWDDKDFKFKVWPKSQDRNAFRAVMGGLEITEDLEESRIAKAHRFFSDNISSWLKTEDEDELDRRCKAIVEVITHGLNFVVINVEGDQLANTIFETLNARGTPLQAWDLVKNYIYEQAGSDPDFEEWFDDELLKFDQDWWQLESGAGRNRRPNIDLYLNHFLVLRRKIEVKGHTSRDLYRAFSDYVQTSDEQGEKSIKGTGTDFSRLGDTYQEVMQKPRSDEFGRFLHHWRVEGHGVLTPVLLWLWSSGVPDRQLSRAVSALDSYFGRRLVCQSSSKDYRELTLGLLRELDSAGSQQAGDTVLVYLKSRSADVDTLQWPSDQELREVLIERPIYSKLTIARLRMVLEAIERQMRRDREYGDDEDIPNGLSIEHVMPQKWMENWKGDFLDPNPQGPSDDETATQRRHRLLHTIGNLTLVNSKLNSKLKNDDWQKKQSTLKENSGCRLSDAIIEHEGNWNEDSIVERSRELAKVLIDVWPDPDAIWDRTRS